MLLHIIYKSLIILLIYMNYLKLKIGDNRAVILKDSYLDNSFINTVPKAWSIETKSWSFIAFNYK